MSCEICGASVPLTTLVFERWTEADHEGADGGTWHLACETCAGLGGLASAWDYWLDVADYLRDRTGWDRHLKLGKAWWTPAVDRSFEAALGRAQSQHRADPITEYLAKAPERDRAFAERARLTSEEHNEVIERHGGIREWLRSPDEFEWSAHGTLRRTADGMPMRRTEAPKTGKGGDD